MAGFREVFVLLRPYRRSLALALLLGLGATAAAALQPLLVSHMVDAFRGRLPVSLGALLLGLLVASALLSGVRQLVLQRSGERFAFDTRERLIRHVFSLPISTLEARDRGDVISRITLDVSQTRALLSSGLVELATNLVTVVVSVVMMALLDWVLLGLTALAICCVLVTVTLIGRRTRATGLRMQTAMGELASVMSRALGSMRTIRATSSARREADSVVRRAASALDAGLVTARLRAAIQTVTGVTVQVLLIVVVAVGALRVASGALTVGHLGAFIMYLLLMVAPISLFAGIVSMLGEAFGAVSRIMALESLEPERDVEDPATPSVPTPTGGADGLRPFFELINVSFRYPGCAESSAAGAGRVFDDLALGFEEGKTTAIVGPSGAGKSTLFALLERFYEPTDGAILFRGQDVRRLSRDQVRGQIAYVEQDAPALSGTVRDNLLLGSHTASDEQCVDVLRKMNLLSWSEPGTEFLDSEVGDLGSRLSGGERQRLAIARALIAGSPILLLDEVTSNLDSNNEKVVQDILHAKARTQSIVVIAHRLSTVVAADRIIVLDKGMVVAQGTHSELLDSSPLYRELARNQLLG
jgi:ATP-binding cassette subfamily B protein